MYLSVGMSNERRKSDTSHTPQLFLSLQNIIVYLFFHNKKIFRIASVVRYRQFFFYLYLQYEKVQ